MVLKERKWKGGRMKYRGIFEYEYPTEHKPPISIDVHLHGDCVKGKIIEWEYRPLEQEPMQVDLEGDGYADGELVYDYGKCPKCGWDFEEGDKEWKQPYCCHCGQKLKWFDNKAESEGEI